MDFVRVKTITSESRFGATFFIFGAWELSKVPPGIPQRSCDKRYVVHLQFESAQRPPRPSQFLI